MTGKIKIYGKAVLLNQYRKMTAMIILSALIILLSNNFFLALKYLFDYTNIENIANGFGEDITRKIVITALTVIVSFLSLIAVLPLKYGKEIWFYEHAKNNRLKVRKIFFAYNPRYSVKAIKLCLNILVRKILWLLIFMLPSIVLASYLTYSLYNGISGSMIVLLVVGLIPIFSTGFVFWFVTIQRYSLSYTLYHENDSSVSDAIKLSTKIADSKCFAIAKLKFSFLPWYLLCAFVFPIIYVYPYVKISVSYYFTQILLGRD